MKQSKSFCKVASDGTFKPFVSNQKTRSPISSVLSNTCLLQKLKYPIGEFQTPKIISKEQRENWIADIESFPDYQSNHPNDQRNKIE